MKKLIAVVVMAFAAMGFAQTLSAADMVTKLGGTAGCSGANASEVLACLVDKGLIGADLAKDIQAKINSNAAVSIDDLTVFVADLKNGTQPTPANLEAAKESLKSQGISITSTNPQTITTITNPPSISTNTGQSQNPATQKK